MAYPTLANIKSYIGNTLTSDDGVLDVLMAGARGFIEGPDGAGRVFDVAADATRRFDAERDVSRDRRTLYLFDDLCQLTSVANGDGSAISLADLVTEPRNEGPYYALHIKRSSSAVWTWDDAPEGAIAVTGRWGYSVTPPADIAQAFYMLVAYLYRRRDNSGGSDRPMIGDGGVLIAPASVPREVMGVLMSYRRRSAW